MECMNKRMLHNGSWCLLVLSTLFACQPTHDVDLVIANATVYDGTANAPMVANVGVVGDQIAWIVSDTTVRAARTVDATGYVLAPGFIDPHTHSLRDLESAGRNSNINYLTQGVTTVVNGNDGGGPLNISEIFDTLTQKGIGTNAAFMAPHRSIRRLVMGMDDRAPTEEELANMQTMVERCMEAGALGLSSGLFYAPASFATTEEVIALAKVAARYDGLYDVHMRDESSYNIGLLNAVRETIEIADKGGLPANISHIKCLGTDVWGQSAEVIRIVDSARTTGLQITADQYPFEASSTSFSAALLPRWVVANDPDYLPKLRNDTLLPRIREGIAENLRRRGGPESILLIRPQDTTLTGLTLGDVAGQLDTDPVNAAIQIILRGGSDIASFNMQESDIEAFMRQPWVMTCSDGGSPHPRKFASYPTKIVKYVQERGVLSLAQMIHRSSGMVADVFGIPKRGYIRPGYFADLILFKPDELQVHSTFAEPVQLSTGMHSVLVNGVFAIEEGEYTGALAGRGVRRE
jgi:N-acyl-D-aspartate/D-glutamate deacylase